MEQSMTAQLNVFTLCCHAPRKTSRDGWREVRKRSPTSPPLIFLLSPLRKLLKNKKRDPSSISLYATLLIHFVVESP